MIISLNELMTEKERATTIRKGYKALGSELYDICKSCDIEPATKKKITKPVCCEFARQDVENFCSNFACGQIEINYSEYDALVLADTISNLSSQEYKNLLEQIKREEEKAEKNYLDSAIDACNRLNDDLGDRTFDN